MKQIKTEYPPLNFNQICLAIVVTFLWAICFPLIETGHRAAPPLQFAAVRSLIASISLLLPMLYLNSKIFVSSTFWVASTWVGLTYTGMGFAGMFLADGRIAPGMATVLANIQPFLAAAMAYFILSEKITKGVLRGMTIGFFGVLIIALQSMECGREFGVDLREEFTISMVV